MNKRLVLRSHEAETLEKARFLTLWIRITNGWNKKWLCFTYDSHEAIFRTLNDTWGGGGQNALFKKATKQCLRILMMLDFDTWFWHLISMLDELVWRTDAQTDNANPRDASRLKSTERVGNKLQQRKPSVIFLLNSTFCIFSLT